MASLSCANVALAGRLGILSGRRGVGGIMTRPVYGVLAAFVFLSLAAMPACAESASVEALKQDYQVCKEGVCGQPSIAACTLLIESGKLSPDELGNIYATRATCHEALGEHDAARSDFDRACQLDDLNC